MRTLEEALALSSETGDVDFKGRLTMANVGEVLELLKDLVAMANSGGGYLLIGLDDNGAPIEQTELALTRTDQADIGDKIYRFTDVRFGDFELLEATKGGAKIAVIKVLPVDIPIVFSKLGSYPLPSGQMKSAFLAGTVYFRHGAKSEAGCTDDLRASYERLLTKTKENWLEGIAKIVEAPAGSRVNILVSPEVGGSTSEHLTGVRIVENADAPEARLVKVDEIYPFRTKELISKFNERVGSKIMGTHHVQCLKTLHQIQENPRFSYRGKFGSPQYSGELLEWLLSEHAADPQFFNNLRTANALLR